MSSLDSVIFWLCSGYLLVQNWSQRRVLILLGVYLGSREILLSRIRFDLVSPSPSSPLIVGDRICEIQELKGLAEGFGSQFWKIEYLWWDWKYRGQGVVSSEEIWKSKFLGRQGFPGLANQGFLAMILEVNYFPFYTQFIRSDDGDLEITTWVIVNVGYKRQARYEVSVPQHFLFSFANIVFISSLVSLFWVFFLSVAYSVTTVSLGYDMSQGSQLGKGLAVMKRADLVPKRRIKVPHFDNSALIAGYAKTLIGRCMNPRLQDMKTLLFMLPRIWQMEGRVVGADLGLGKFQFDFDNEEDIVAVLKNEPFHFDHWMVALVRWKPSVDPSYPSMITFWVRVLGVPLQFWADPTFQSIGDGLGQVHYVDIDTGRVQVTVDGLKPLCFETEVEFDNGEVTVVTLRYERLFGHCRVCFSLCHDDLHCGLVEAVVGGGSNGVAGVVNGDRKYQSFKGVVAKEKNGGSGSEGTSRGGQKDQVGGQRSRSEHPHGEPVRRPRRFQNYVQYNEHRHTAEARAEARAAVEARAAAATRNAAEAEALVQFRANNGVHETVEIAVVAKNPTVARRALFQEGDGDIDAGIALEPEIVAAAEIVEGVDAEIVEGVDAELVDGVDADLVEGVEAELAVDSGEVLPMDELLGAELPIPATEIQGISTTELFLQNAVMEELGAVCIAANAEVTLMEEEGCEFQDSVPLPLELVVPSLDMVTSLEIAMGNTEVDSETAEGSSAQVDASKVAGKAKVSGKEGTGGEKGKKAKGFAFKGASSKKRIAQLLTSPRKRPASNGVDFLEGDGSSKDQGVDRGAPGGSKPPRSTASK